jgi:GDSL-like lipase/acylhydrolase family protein
MKKEGLLVNGVLFLFATLSLSAADFRTTGEVFQVTPKKNEIQITANQGALTVRLNKGSIIKKYQPISKEDATTQNGAFVQAGSGYFDKRFDKNGIQAYRVNEWLVLPNDSLLKPKSNNRLLRGKLNIGKEGLILKVDEKRFILSPRHNCKFFKIEPVGIDSIKLKDTVTVSGKLSGKAVEAKSVTVIYNQYAAPETAGLPRVLLIGDSISLGYTPDVRELLKGKANVLRIPANGGPTPRMLANHQRWLGAYRQDGFKWDVIHFNFGLHDLRIFKGENKVDLATYEKNLRAIVKLLQATNAKLIWASTTPVPENANKGSSWGEPTNTDVLKYNAAAAKIMAENNIVIDDLYNAIFPVFKTYLRTPTNIHYNSEGSKILATQAVLGLNKALKKDGGGI